MLGQRECTRVPSIRKSVGANCSVELFQRALAARLDPELERRFVATHVNLVRRLAPLTLLGLVLAAHVLPNWMLCMLGEVTRGKFGRVDLCDMDSVYAGLCRNSLHSLGTSWASSLFVSA